MTEKHPAADVTLSVRLAEDDRACVVFRAPRGEGPRTGAIPTMVGALLASTLARLGPGPHGQRLLRDAERTAGTFAHMGQPNILPQGVRIVEPDELDEAHEVCTVLMPSDGDAFVRSVFRTDDPEISYKAFLFALQHALDSLTPDTLVSLSSVLRGVVSNFKNAVTWPDIDSTEQALAAGRLGLQRRFRQDVGR